MKSLLLLPFAFIVFVPALALASHTSTPIKTFTASAQKTTAGQPTILSWTTQELSGVNIQISCDDSVFAYSPRYNGNLPCGRPAFSSPLETNSSLTLTFINASPDNKSLLFLLLPSFDGKTYDATHGSSLTLTISNNIILDPIVDYFNASSTNVTAGNPVILSWSARYVKGVNMIISCNQTVTTATSSDARAPDLPCDTNAFIDNLPPNGTRTFFFRTAGMFFENVLFTLIPVMQNGGYDLTQRRTLLLSVHLPLTAPPATSSPSTPLPIPITASSVSSPPIPSTAIPALLSQKAFKKQPAFTTFLARGSKSVQVKLLQEFLKKDFSLYPEGIVSSFFGPATERAIQRFQKKNGIADIGLPGYGTVGPKTRSKLNELH